VAFIFLEIHTQRFELLAQVSEEVAAHLKEAGVDVKGYADVAEDVKSVAVSGSKLWMDPSKVPNPTLPYPHHPTFSQWARWS
jgi:hypothetical protein